VSDADDTSAVAETLRSHGVPAVFAPVEPRDAPLPHRLAEAGIAVVRTLHAQTAVFAAEAWAKVTRRPGVAVVSGATGLPNAVTGVANAHATGSPLVVIDDRRGAGPVDGIDHLALARTISRSAVAVGPGDAAAGLAWACEAANRPPRGPVLVEVGGADPLPVPAPQPGTAEPDKAALEHIAELVGGAQRPVLVAGGNVYWSGAEAALRRFAETVHVPVVMNGMGRGTLPADHDLALSRARPSALRRADLVLVAGTPLDFRLGYGRFGSARVVHLCEDPTQIATQAEIAAAAAGDLALLFDRLTELTEPNPLAALWTDDLRSEEGDLRHAEAAAAVPQDDGAAPPPLRAPGLYAELRRHLERDAVVIGDGGDFVSYAGRFVDTFTPGCFLDPGPYGCLGIGLGYAIGARLAHPERQVVVLLGDGAAGFSLMEFETLVRLGRPAVLVVGNNDGWGLEKHHMEALYGYHVVADLAPGTRYDEVARGLGGHGELVREASDLGPALERAFASALPALVNVALDPADAYQRSTMLA
jgi:acetolactate synthase-1/2/3 large subunit